MIAVFRPSPDSQPLHTTFGSEESAIEDLCERLAAVLLELRSTQQDLEDSNNDLVSALEDLADATREDQTSFTKHRGCSKPTASVC